MPTIILDKKWTHPTSKVEKPAGTEIDFAGNSDIAKDILKKNIGHVKGAEDQAEEEPAPAKPKNTLSRKSKPKKKKEDND